LKDTVRDMGDLDGWGIRFNQPSVGDAMHAVGRAFEVYQNKTHLNWMRRHMMQIDNSWEHAVQQYIDLYRSMQ
jgi:starch synthase